MKKTLTFLILLMLAPAAFALWYMNYTGNAHCMAKFGSTYRYDTLNGIGVCKGSMGDERVL